MAIQQRNMSGDPNFDLWEIWDDVSLKLQAIRCVNRYTNEAVTVRAVPYDINTGIEDPSSALSRTFAPGEDVTLNAPQNGAHVIFLTLNSRGIPIGYNTSIGVSPA
jgi:hypothetical protein